MLTVKSSIYYFLTITLLFIIGIAFLPFGYWNYSTVIYILIGPVFFGLNNYLISQKLNQHVVNQHPELIKKYALHFGFWKGTKLNALDVLQNKKEFLAKNDSKLSKLIFLNLRNISLIIYSFFVLIVVVTVGIMTRT